MPGVPDVPRVSGVPEVSGVSIMPHRHRVPGVPCGHGVPGVPVVSGHPLYAMCSLSPSLDNAEIVRRRICEHVLPRGHKSNFGSKRLEASLGF